MKLCRQTREDKPPSIDDCLAHRCLAHREVPPLDDSVDTDAECGICVGHKMSEGYAKALEEEIVVPLLEGFADLLTSHCELKEKLEVARRRLELLSPGAGKYLEQGVTLDSESS